MSPVGGKRGRGGDGGDDVGRQRRWNEALTRIWHECFSICRNSPLRLSLIKKRPIEPEQGFPLPPIMGHTVCKAEQENREGRSIAIILSYVCPSIAITLSKFGPIIAIIPRNIDRSQKLPSPSAILVPALPSSPAMWIPSVTRPTDKLVPALRHPNICWSMPHFRLQCGSHRSGGKTYSHLAVQASL